MSDYISRQAAIDKLKSEPIGRMIFAVTERGKKNEYICGQVAIIM